MRGRGRGPRNYQLVLGDVQIKVVALERLDRDLHGGGAARTSARRREGGGRGEGRQCGGGGGAKARKAAEGTRRLVWREALSARGALSVVALWLTLPRCPALRPGSTRCPLAFRRACPPSPPSSPVRPLPSCTRQMACPRVYPDHTRRHGVKYLGKIEVHILILL